MTASGAHEHAAHTPPGGLNALAASATLHCLTGCAIGEILGLVIGTAAGLSQWETIAVAVGLAFVFGYLLSTLPILRGGAPVAVALRLVLAADTLSILTMEIVDNSVMALIPGAMEAGLDNEVFWLGMLIALTAAFFAAYPVNRYLLQRGKGHSLLHQFHHGPSADAPIGWRSRLPNFSTKGLVATIAAFLVGGFVAAAGAPDRPDDADVPAHSTLGSQPRP